MNVKNFMFDLKGKNVKEEVEFEVTRVYKSDDYEVRKEWECPMGYNPFVSWVIYHPNSDLVGFFKTKKNAILAVDLMRNEFIENTGDIESRMVRFFNENGLDLPKGL